MAERMFNLIPTDIGRPIGQINTNIAAEKLDDLIHKVVATMTPHEIEAQDRQGRWYLVKIRPYKNVDNRIDGALVTVTDIGTERKLRDEGTRLRMEATEALETSHEPIVVTDQDGHIRMANPAFGRLVGLPGNESPKGTLFDLLPRDWDLPALRTLMGRVQASGEKVDDTPVELSGKGDGRVLVSVRRVSSDAGAGTLLTVHLSQPSGEAPPSSAVVKKGGTVVPSRRGEGNADH